MSDTTSRRTRLMRMASESGLYVATWSPGDGATRYRFFKNKKPVSFFRQSGLYTALGLSEAETWLSGYRRGR